jgi:hypothetical protein
MTRTLPAMHGRTLALAAANLVVAAIAVWPWLPDRAQSARISAAPSVAARPMLASLPPLAAFTATSERPLFSPSRRPPAAAAPRGTSALDGRYRLLGLVIAGTARRALVAEIAGGRKFEIGEGEAIEGWVVKRIDRDAVLLASPSGEATLTLRNAAGAAPATKP